MTSQSPSNTDDQTADSRPRLETKRLVLRPFELGDCTDVQRICSDREIAANTRTVEHPYPEGAAEVWIKQHPQFWQSGKSAIFAICLESGELVGAIGLEIHPEDHNAELGYWVEGVHRGNGYATEAAREVIQFGFRELGLHRVFAHHLSRNPSSGRVMIKAGMMREGKLRGHNRKWGVFEDIEIYGVLKTDKLTASSDENPGGG